MYTWLPALDSEGHQDQSVIILCVGDGWRLRLTVRLFSQAEEVELGARFDRPEQQHHDDVGGPLAAGSCGQGEMEGEFWEFKMWVNRQSEHDRRYVKISSSNVDRLVGLGFRMTVQISGRNVDEC